MNQFTIPSDSYTIIANGDSGYTIIFKQSVSQQLTKKLTAISDALNRVNKLFLLDTIPSYQSITLLFDPLKSNRKLFLERLIMRLAAPFAYLANQQRLIEIPVCYETEYAPDLTELARLIKLSTNEVINKHSETTYWVNMLGFLPGFLYLSGLNKELNCPRKNNPNLRIAPGSIAIGGDQTGIYPIESPGGWHVIGRTPIKTFTPDSDEPAIARPLDEIKFIAISKAKFISIASAQNATCQ